MEIDQSWIDIDQYFADKLIADDPTMDEVLDAMLAAELPEQQVTAAQGKFLQMMAGIIGAKRILEIGTLGGYSTVWMARALPEDGKVVTLELETHHAAVARRNFEKAGVSSTIECRVGPAVESLEKLYEEGVEPFDFVFIDADKVNNVAYFEWSLKLSRPGTVMIIDNVVRGGQVVDADNDDPSVIGTRQLIDVLSDSNTVTVTALQTVGNKGWDGFAIVRVNK